MTRDLRRISADIGISGPTILMLVGCANSKKAMKVCTMTICIVIGLLTRQGSPMSDWPYTIEDTERWTSSDWHEEVQRLLSEGRAAYDLLVRWSESGACANTDLSQDTHAFLTTVSEEQSCDHVDQQTYEPRDDSYYCGKCGERLA